MTGHALQEGQGVADTITGCRRELTRVEEGVDGDDLLKQTGHDAKAVPENQREFRDLFPFLAQLHEGALSPVRVQELGYPL